MALGGTRVVRLDPQPVLKARELFERLRRITDRLNWEVVPHEQWERLDWEIALLAMSVQEQLVRRYEQRRLKAAG